MVCILQSCFIHCTDVFTVCVCTNVCAMCIVAVAHVFIVGDGNALLGVLWDLLLAMHGGAGRHAPITSLWSKQHANSAPPQSTHNIKPLQYGRMCFFFFFFPPAQCEN